MNLTTNLQSFPDSIGEEITTKRKSDIILSVITITLLIITVCYGFPGMAN